MKNTKTETPEMPLVPVAAALPVDRPAPTSALDLLGAALAAGLTKDNVEVVEKLVQLRREEVAEQAKREFAKALFALKKDIAKRDLYADKEAKTDSGAIAYRYCSEEEISKMLEPLLMQYGFAMLTGQKQDEALVTVEVTLIHEGGYQHVSGYTVRPGATNRMKDATAADTGATTSAWRHLMIKMFGLKSRINPNHDPRNMGENITPEQAAELRNRVKLLNLNEKKFLEYGQIKNVQGEPNIEHYKQIKSLLYETLDVFLRGKEKQGR